MRRRAHITVIALLGATFLATGTSPSSVRLSAACQTGGAVPETRPSTIAASVREYLRQAGVPGAAVAVTQGRDVLLAEGFGRTPSGGRIGADTPMAIASLSKSVTALAVMQLVEAGAVDLDGPVRAYLPEFTMADPRADGITVRQLLNHTSGLSDRTFRPFSGPQPASPRGLVGALRDVRLARAPGTSWEYHNPNYQVAARLVEVVSGRPFATYLRERVFDPLGMRDSLAIDTAAQLPATAAGHIRILGAPLAVPEPRAFGGGSGGVISSARDMAAWLITHVNGGVGPTGVSVCSDGSIVAMRTPTATSRAYGLGWFVGTSPSGAPRVWHGGDLFTSTAQQILLPQSGHGIAVMTNTGLAYGDARALADRILALLEGREPPRATAWPFVVVDALLLSLAAVALALAVTGTRRASRWAGQFARRPVPLVRLLPLGLPLLVLITIHRVVGALYRGRDVAWIQVPYLFPTFVLFLGAATAGGAIVLAARVAALVRGRRAARRRDS